MILCNLSNQKSKLSVNLIFLSPPGINLSLSTTWTSYWFTISSHLITLKPHPLPNEGLGNCGLLSYKLCWRYTPWSLPHQMILVFDDIKDVTAGYQCEVEYTLLINFEDTMRFICQFILLHDVIQLCKII